MHMYVSHKTPIVNMYINQILADNLLGVVIGIIFGIILASTTTFVVVLIIILNKKSKQSLSKLYQYSLLHCLELQELQDI